MTTTVTVNAVNWPVEVRVQDMGADGGVKVESSETVPPNSMREFHITQTRRLVVTEREIPKEASTDQANGLPEGISITARGSDVPAVAKPADLASDPNFNAPVVVRDQMAKPVQDTTAKDVQPPPKKP